MVANLNGILSKVTSKGASLLRKDTGMKISKDLKLGISIPESAQTFDAVRVGRNFNPKDFYTDILTFRNSDGNIVKRYIKKVDKTNIVETTKGYEEIYPDTMDLTEDGSKYLDIYAKKIRSHVRENGKLSYITEDVFSHTDEPKPIFTHFGKKIKPNFESILIDQRQNGQPTKFLQNDYKTSIYENGDFTLINSKASSPELNDIAQNTYLLPFVSPKNKFAYRMAQANIKDSNFILDPKVSLFRKKSTLGGCYHDDGTVNINLKGIKDLSLPRERLTETIGHEIGHAKWDEKCFLYKMYTLGMDDGDFLRRHSKAEIPDIKRYQKAIDNYVSPATDLKAYLNNFAEKIARKEGAHSVNKYVKLHEKIDEEFPYKHVFQFYDQTSNDDEIAGIMSILNSMSC